MVEDERRLAQLVARGLTEAGHDTATRYIGPDGLLAAATGRFDVVVLDRMRPGLDGVAVCGRRAPVLMLTTLGEVSDRVAGADADDYLTKPFSFGELLARPPGDDELTRLGHSLTDMLTTPGRCEVAHPMPGGPAAAGDPKSA